MIDVLIIVRDVLFAVLMSWAGLDGEDSRQAPDAEAPASSRSAPRTPLTFSQSMPGETTAQATHASCRA